MIKEELTTEQTSEVLVEDAIVYTAVEEIEMQETPEVETPTNGITNIELYYLDPQLFIDIRTISKKEIVVV